MIGFLVLACVVVLVLINVPIAVLLWLMIYPMMLRIDLASVLGVRRRPRGIRSSIRDSARTTPTSFPSGPTAPTSATSRAAP